MLNKLQKRDDELNNEQEQVKLLPLPLPSPFFLSPGQQQMDGGKASILDFGGMGVGTSSHALMFLENLRNDQWFIETISQEQNITYFLRASPDTDVVASSTAGGGGDERPLGGMDMLPSPPNNDSAP
ncbi:hypothetical protein Pfo_004001 [Paulownia fortunei]|nr:hypothetical protein Pfo_004001 [Paulownia fortunei]